MNSKFFVILFILLFFTSCSLFEEDLTGKQKLIIEKVSNEFLESIIEKNCNMTFSFIGETLVNLRGSRVIEVASVEKGVLCSQFFRPYLNISNNEEFNLNYDVIIFSREEFEDSFLEISTSDVYFSLDEDYMIIYNNKKNARLIDSNFYIVRETRKGWKIILIKELLEN